MDFTGIIAEYDPFHNGHAAQLAAVRAAGAQCIAVCMSSGAVLFQLCHPHKVNMDRLVFRHF